MRSSPMTGLRTLLRVISVLATIAVAPAVFGQHVTFSPYIQLGDNGAFSRRRILAACP